MANQKVYVPLTGPKVISDLSSNDQSKIITFVDGTTHVEEQNISLELIDNVVTIVIIPTLVISADYIANIYINSDLDSFERNVIYRSSGVITKVGKAVIVTPPVIATLNLKTEVPSVSPSTLSKDVDISKTSFGDLKTIIANWTGIPASEQIIGTSKLGPISESSVIEDSTYLIDCKVYLDGAWQYYFTAEGAQVAVLDNRPLDVQSTQIPNDYKVCLYYSS